MATKYIQQATKQLAPAYAGSINAQKAQIPAIQQLYQTLTQGLQQQNTQQLNTGVNNIVEDASARGVLRSTLPVDARQALTAQLGAALNQGLSQLGVQQAQDIGGIRSNISNLRLERAKDVSGLANTLYQQALAKQQADREFRLRQQSLAMSRSGGGRGGGGGGRAPTQAQIRGAIAQGLLSVRGKDGYISPQDYAQAYLDWTRAGLSAGTFKNQFQNLKNPNNGYYDYAISQAR